MIIDLELSLIRTDGGTQMRAVLDQRVCDEYGFLWEAGVAFEPVDVFHDAETYWLADGFHRVVGAGQAGRATIPARVHQGTKRDAILFACGANASHGLRRKNGDKRRAVETLLNDEEWCRWSDRQIAEKAGVSHTLVAHIRQELATVASSPAALVAGEPRLGLDGKQRQVPQKESIGLAGDETEAAGRGSGRPAFDPPMAAKSSDGDLSAHELRPDCSNEPIQVVSLQDPELRQRLNQVSRLVQSIATDPDAGSTAQATAAKALKLLKSIRSPKAKQQTIPGVDAIQFPPSLDTPAARDALARYITERRERKIKALTQSGIRLLLKEWEEKGSDRFVAAVNHAIASGYQGIFEVGQNGHGRQDPTRVRAPGRLTALRQPAAPST